MLSPFRFFRSRPSNGIRIDEDETNYENLLGTAVGSDAEEEDSNNFYNNSSQNQVNSNQPSSPQNRNTSFSNNNNDIFGDFSHFSSMGNDSTTFSTDNTISTNNSNNKGSNYEAFNLFSNNENINLFSNNSNNNKRVGSTGDINIFYDKSKNPYSPNNPNFEDNKLVSSISESQIFNKNHENIGNIYINLFILIYLLFLGVKYLNLNIIFELFKYNIHILII